MKKTYTLKLEGKEWTEVLKKAFNKNKKDIKEAGFRKGQVPYDIYVKRHGIESLYMDASDIALEVLYKKLMEDKETITSVATPRINLTSIDEKHIEVEITIVGKPEVKLGKYKNLGIKKEVVEVTKEEIEKEINHIKSYFSDLKVIDDKIKKGNIAIIDFEGFLEGKPFDGGKGEDYNLEIGSNTFIPGFEEGLIGLKKGDKKDLKLKFPENYGSKELSGKDVVFKVEIKEVKERVLPEINEEFFKDLNIEGVKTKKELDNYIKEYLSAQKERSVNEEYFVKCMDEVVKNAEFEIPTEMTEDEVEALTKDFAERLKMQGLNLETYLQYTNGNIDNFKKTLEEEANKKIGYRLVLDEVIIKEKLEVTDEEYKEEIKKALENFKVKEEEFLKQFGSKEGYVQSLLMKKASEVILGEKK